jgi:AcrR family transcriptional regulator
MPMTLRQRNRLAAVRAIQEVAIGLFDERGYHHVTVEDIVRAAGVSTSTFYRYFGTKEGLFTTDTFASVGADTFTEVVDLDDPAATMERLAARATGGRPWPGMRYVIEEPVVRAAVYAAMDSVAEQIADALAAHGRTRNEARVLARTLLFGVYFGALEQWHRDGRKRPIGEYAREAMAALRFTAGG